MTYNPIAKGTSDWDVPVNSAFSDHEARIVQNTTDISTNTLNIATNTSDITTKVSRAGDTMTGLLLLNNPSNISLIAQANGTNNLAEFKNSGGTVRTAINPTGNLQTSSTAFITTGMQVGSVNTDFGNGTGGIIGIDDATASPNANPTGGVIVYSESGGLRIRHANGDVIVLSNLNTLDAQPFDHGLKAWTQDPAACGSTGSVNTSGVIYLSKVMLRTAASISNLYVAVTTGGTTLTSGQNLVGLYNSSGTKLVEGADQTTAFGTAGLKTVPITTQNLTAGSYYIAIMSNGTTPAAFMRGNGASASALNVNLAVSSGRFLDFGTGQTTLPSSITLSSASTNASARWAAMN